jgi:hypothetical protein
MTKNKLSKRTLNMLVLTTDKPIINILHTHETTRVQLMKKNLTLLVNQ